MRRMVMILAVAFVAIGAFWTAGVGCGDDDSTTTGCPSAAACSTGSCCAGRPGTWNTSLGRCICPDASAEVDVAADADADADADVTPDETVTPEDVTVPDETTGCTAEMGGPCNAVIQCGCGTGERCVLNASNTEECAPTGTDPTGTACGSADNCVRQNQCFGTSATDSECMQFCYENADCPTGRTCDYGITGITGYRLCGDLPVDCNPFDATGCSSGQVCNITEFTVCNRACGAAGTGTAGATCDTTGCVGGFGCLTTTGGPPYSCIKYCNPTGTPDCADVPSTTCQSIGAGTCEGFGLCLAP